LLALVPGGRLFDVLSRLRADTDVDAHSRLRMSSITSAAGSPRLPSAA
jgi:hypothetical protein